MATWLQFNPSDAWVRVLTVLVDIGVKGLIMLALAWLVATAMRRASAAARHLVWALALAGLLLLPALSLVMPRWQMPILPGATSIRLFAQAAQTAQTHPEAETVSTVAPPVVQPGLPMPPAIATDAKPSAPEIMKAPEPAPQPIRTLSIAQWAVLLWLAGVLATLVPLVAGLALVARMRRRARPLDLPPFPELAGVAVEARQTPYGAMPMATGLVRPVILLPCDFAEWGEEKRRAVLLHELAHVRRCDCLTHALARVGVALHWFNPLAWVALRRLRAERERACDDLVLTAGERPSAYADHLLDIARTTHAGALESVAAITMAKRSQLEGRLLAILEKKCNRKRVTRQALVLGIGLSVCLALSIAAIQPVQAAQKTRPDVEQLIRENPQVLQITGTVNQIKVIREQSLAGKFPLFGLSSETQHRVYRVSGNQGSAVVTVDRKKRLGRWKNAIVVKPEPQGSTANTPNSIELIEHKLTAREGQWVWKIQGHGKQVTLKGQDGDLSAVGGPGPWMLKLEARFDGQQGLLIEHLYKDQFFPFNVGGVIYKTPFTTQARSVDEIVTNILDQRAPFGDESVRVYSLNPAQMQNTPRQQPDYFIQVVNKKGEAQDRTAANAAPSTTTVSGGDLAKPGHDQQDTSETQKFP